MSGAYSLSDYPIIENRPEDIVTPGGVRIEDITFENIERGAVSVYDCRTSKEGLLAQAAIAELTGDRYIAGSLKRAAEMVDIDGDKIIEIYNALRPYRSSEEDLTGLAFELRTKYGAEENARFIEEATAALKHRRKLRGNR
ncbi:MAG: diol dehydratase small subunit [Clostridiales Family XIII bacterium]|jgi:propanediol dehydratase small subunit|nr:diol dehydratase small subunit [Clostridiales Family XIII bacterium]